MEREHGVGIQEMNQSELKEQGILQASSKHERELSLARGIAIDYVLSVGGLISIDDVRMTAASHGLEIDFSGNWTGAIFKEKHWEYVDMVPSKHKGGHARKVSRWRLKDGYKYPPKYRVYFYEQPIQRELFVA